MSGTYSRTHSREHRGMQEIYKIRHDPMEGEGRTNQETESRINRMFQDEHDCMDAEGTITWK